MKTLFKGFDRLVADEELKEKTVRKILAQSAAPKIGYIRIKKAIAACLAVVLVGGGAFAAMQSGFFDIPQGSNSLSTGKTEYIFDATFNDTAGEKKEEEGIFDDTFIVEDPTDAVADEETTADTDTKKPESYKTTTDEATTTTTGGALKKPGSGGSTQSYQTAAGVLTAKEWNDNLNFDFWLNLLGQNSEFQQYQTRWGINLTKRIEVAVESGQQPIGGATVSLLDEQGNAIWSAVSDNKGKAYLFYHVLKQDKSPKKITVKYGDKAAEQSLENTPASSYTLSLSEAKKQNTALDLMFVCDTTGSMGDELHYLQTELADIILRVKNQNGNIPLRLSVNFYRDVQDEYVIRSFPFVSDINTAIGNLKAQSANGGGDTEEAVEQALNDAINKHEWSADASAKLLFLILDAPPHDTAKAKMQELVATAAKNGIRIIPITASGIDKNTEYLMRTLSLGTGGTYVTLTDDSGIGNSHLEPTIGESKVYKLNDLLVRIINDFLS